MRPFNGVGFPQGMLAVDSFEARLISCHPFTVAFIVAASDLGLPDRLAIYILGNLPPIIHQFSQHLIGDY
jgi:hypothetical protein